nr:MAG TPA: hypothetical protein [Caudoviricetes sp.]
MESHHTRELTRLSRGYSPFTVASTFRHNDKLTL